MVICKNAVDNVLYNIYYEIFKKNHYHGIRWIDQYLNKCRLIYPY